MLLLLILATPSFALLDSSWLARRPISAHVSKRNAPLLMGLFDSIKQAFDDDIDATSGGKSAIASHILMKNRNQALLLKEQIDAGEIGFADAARKYSSCPSSGKGGSLGQFGPGEMAPAFDSLVFDPDTAVGDINVCATQFGTHLIQVRERTGVEQTARAEVAAKAEAAAAAAAAAEAAGQDPIRQAAERAAAAAAVADAASTAPAEGSAGGAMMEVVCPDGLADDRVLRIALPDAREFDVVVPDGVAAGATFLVGPFP